MMKYLKLFFSVIGRIFIFDSKFFNYLPPLIYGGYVGRKIHIMERHNFLCDKPLTISGGQYISIESGRIKDHCRMEALYTQNTPPISVLVGIFV